MEHQISSSWSLIRAKYGVSKSRPLMCDFCVIYIVTGTLYMTTSTLVKAPFFSLCFCKTFSCGINLQVLKPHLQYLQERLFWLLTLRIGTRSRGQAVPKGLLTHVLFCYCRGRLVSLTRWLQHGESIQRRKPPSLNACRNYRSQRGLHQNRLPIHVKSLDRNLIALTAAQ